MSVETLTYIPYAELWTVAVAISLLSKLKIKREERPDVDPSELEIDHILPKHKGGTSDRENLQALTPVEHAQKHFWDAFNNKKDWPSAKKDYGAVRLIVKRIKSQEELDSFNDSINE